MAQPEIEFKSRDVEELIENIVAFVIGERARKFGLRFSDLPCRDVAFLGNPICPDSERVGELWAGPEDLPPRAIGKFYKWAVMLSAIEIDTPCCLGPGYKFKNRREIEHDKIAFCFLFWHAVRLHADF